MLPVHLGPNLATISSKSAISSSQATNLLVTAALEQLEGFLHNLLYIYIYTYIFRRFHIERHMLTGWDYFNAIQLSWMFWMSPSNPSGIGIAASSLRRLGVPSAVEFEDPIWSGEVRSHQSREAGTRRSTIERVSSEGQP